MKSKLNTILQLAIIVLLAVVIALQIFNISNKDADSDDFVEKNLSQQKQWMDHIKEVGKKNITVTNDKISRGDYSTYIIGDVTNTSNDTVYDVGIYITLYKDNNIVGTSSDSFRSIAPNSTLSMEGYVTEKDFDTYTIDYVTGVIYD
ncbi:FxLYD domain-containing protein [Porcipelethomonas sp.]|jgi:hypothetical protein|uniref:FxLYD domain-containing protein n=1 Tax=Porcipelethomonas sp. TaxID=2981675 RepID=UPI0030789195